MNKGKGNLLGKDREISVTNDMAEKKAGHGDNEGSLDAVVHKAPLEGDI